MKKVRGRKGACCSKSFSQIMCCLSCYAMQVTQTTTLPIHTCLVHHSYLDSLGTKTDLGKTIKWNKLTVVLVSAGIELIFFSVASAVLYFGFVVRAMLIAH